MTSLPLLSATALGLVSVISAQTAIFPPYTGTADGQTYQATGALSYGPTRWQTIYDKNELTIPNQSMIKSIGFRQDCQTRSGSVGYRLQIEVKAGDSNKTDANVSGTYANNYLTQPTTVFAKGFWDLPNLPTPTAILPAPSTNVATIPITPFLYNDANNLLTEIIVYANTNANQQFYYYLDVMTHSSPSTSFGTGCQTSTNTIPVLANNNPSLGQNWSLSLTKGPNNAPTAVLLGGDNVNWSGNALPFDLGLFGAPGCKLSVNFLVTINATSGGSGTAGYNIYVPPDLKYAGLTLYAQSAMYDPFANNFGIVTSNGVSTKFGAPARAWGAYSYNNAAATSGSVYYTDGTVTLFGY